MPNHIAMILDGNRRWARAKGLQPWEGHKAGYAALKKVARLSRLMGVNTFTVWGWSTENWERPEKETTAVMELIRQALMEMEKELHEDQVRFVHLGRKDRLPKDLVDTMIRIENETRNYTANVFNVALDYGGRDEIVRAVNKIVEIRKINNETREVTEKEFEQYLDTADQPYPYVDLFIRTSGEQRTSGLLPWQMTYAEIYWEVDHLPDFTPEKLKEAILDYSRRRRRFGGNDKEEHLKFKPEAVARLELDWKRELPLGESKRFRDLVIKYVKEQYGLSKGLAKSAGISLAKALVYREQEDWVSAKESLKGLYEVVKSNLHLAMEPEIIANIEVDLWKPANGTGQESREQKYRKLYSELYRISDLQAAKAAHLSMLANGEADKKNWGKAKIYSEMFYRALKERVA